MRPSLPFLAIALAAAATPASAWADCEPTTSNPEIMWGNGYEYTIYIDNDLCQPECLYSYWIYQESNGIWGLQRGDEVVDDTCGGQIEADTILW